MTQKQYRYLEFSIVYCQAQASYHRPDMISDHISSVALRVRLAGSLEQGTKDSGVWFVWPL